MSKNREGDIKCTKIARALILAGASIASLFIASACFWPQYHSALAQYSGGQNHSQDPTVIAANASTPFTLNSTTVFKTYNVYLRITPNVNGDVNSTGFQVRFMDLGDNPVNTPITYNFSITDKFLSNITEVDNQVTDASGVGKPLVVKFGNPGLVEITVWTMSNNTSTGVPESANFETVVAPEIPQSMTILCLAGAVGVFVVIVSAKRSIYPNLDRVPSF